MNSKEQLLLSILTDVRGRLDEVDALLRRGDEFVVPAPISISSNNVHDITPETYREWRVTGNPSSTSIGTYQPFQEFFQFATDVEDATCQVSAFELTELHKRDESTAYGLLAESEANTQEWFTYELVADGSITQDFVWTEWILKLSTDVPTDILCQFVLDTDDTPRWINAGNILATEFGKFFHVRLNRDAVIEQARGANVNRVRLILSMGNKAAPIRLYNFSMFGSTA